MAMGKRKSEQTRTAMPVPGASEFGVDCAMRWLSYRGRASGRASIWSRRTLRVAAAVRVNAEVGDADQGWYLLIPPVAQAGPGSTLGAPLWQWRQVAGFDTANECEAARLPIVQRAQAGRSKLTAIAIEKDDEMAR